MDSFEFGLPLLVLGVTGAAGLIIYIVSIFAMKEKTFEEAIAEQKEISVELLGRKEERPKKKGPGVKQRKVKVKAHPQHQHQQQPKEQKEKDSAPSVHVHPHVEICARPTILDEHTSLRRPSLPRRDSIKSILVNKSEISPVGDGEGQPELIVNHFEISHPKDDCELKKQISQDEDVLEEEQEQDEQLQQQEIEETILKTEAVVVESIQPVNGNGTASGSETTAPPVGGKKSGKKMKKEKEQELNARGVLNVIEKVNLTRDEIQELIEYLLNRQLDAGITTEWVNKSKSDTTASLKKLLSDREKQLAEEQNTVETLQTKLKDLRAEFSVERNRLSAQRKALEDRNNSITQENTSLSIRLQQLNSSMQEKSNMERQLQELQRRTQVLHDENIGLKKVLSAEQNFRLKSEGLEREAEALRTQCSHLESQLKSSFQSNSDLANQLRALQDHSRGLEMKSVAYEDLQGFSAQLQERENHLINELKTFEQKLIQAEGEKNSLREQLNMAENEIRVTREDGERRIDESHQSEKNAKNLLQDTKSNLSQLEGELRNKENELKNVVKERDNLTSEIKTLNQKLVEGGQGLEKRLAVSESAILSLTREKDDLENELRKSKGEIETVKKQTQELEDLKSKLGESEKHIIEEKKKHDETVSSIKDSLQSLTKVHFNKESESWLEDFASEIQKAKAEVPIPPPAPAPVKENNGEIVRLQGEVEHYQTALKTTESLLRSLELSIQSAEKDWKDKLHLREEELENLRKNSAEVAKDLKKTEAELRDTNSTLQIRIKELEESSQNNSKEDSHSIASVEDLKAENEGLKAELLRLSSNHPEVANGNGTTPKKQTTPTSPPSNDGDGDSLLSPTTPTSEPKKKKKVRLSPSKTNESIFKGCFCQKMRDKSN